MKRLLWIGLLLILLAGCSTAPQELHSTSLFAMDTVMELSACADQRVLDEATGIITGLEEQISVTREGSEIYALNQQGCGTLTGDGAELFGRALALCQKTDGALDLSIYPVVQAWGFTTENYAVPPQAALEQLLARVDYSRIGFDPASGAVTLEPGMEVDLGSVAKGYLSSRLTAFFRDRGVTSALVNLGGNVQALGCKPDGTPWRIGVQDPMGSDYLGVLEIENKAVITSGGYERYFEQDGKTYWHILNPKTGTPAEAGLISVTVVGEDGLLCDGLSTALFVMGLEKAEAFWQSSADFEAIFVTADQQIIITEGLAESFTLTGSYSGLSIIEREAP